MIDSYYEIIKADGDIELERKVNRKISIGYKPIGGVAIGYRQITNTWVFCQAMLREGKEQS